MRRKIGLPVVAQIYGAIAVIVNLFASLPRATAALFRGELNSRVPATLLIALGGFIPGVTSGLNRFGFTWSFFLGELIGVVLIFSGFLVSTEVFSSFAIGRLFVLSIPASLITMRAQREAIGSIPLSDRLKNALGPALWKRAAEQNPEFVITQKKSADVLSRMRGEKPPPGAASEQPAAAVGPAPPAVTGPNPEEVKAAQANAQANIDAARAAIAAGKDRGVVIQRLQQFKIPIPPDL